MSLGHCVLVLIIGSQDAIASRIAREKDSDKLLKRKQSLFIKKGKIFSWFPKR
jgi:hypothetical protein